MSAKKEELTYSETLPDATETDAVEVAEAKQDEPTGNETSDQIRAEIEETRAELTETIDALQDKLDPNRIKDRAIDATVGKVQNLAHSAQEKIAPAVETAKKLNEAAAPAKEKVKEKIPVVIDYVRNNPKIAAGVGVALAVIGFVIKSRRASANYWA